MSENSKLPWSIRKNENRSHTYVNSSDGYTVLSIGTLPNSQFDAELIVTAVNAYADNQKLIGDLVEVAKKHKKACMGYAGESAHKGNRSNQEFWTDEAKSIEALIAKAEKK